MGRKVEFDSDKVIEKAMQTFWQKGYENTSMADLVSVTGLQKGSIYNAFGSKEKLFTLCLERYGKSSRDKYYKGDDPRSYLINFFNRLIDEGSRDDFTKGCMIMNSCLEFSDQNNLLAKRSIELFCATELNFKNVIEAILGDDHSEVEVYKRRLIVAAFSIREISKFRKDREFLIDIANNAFNGLNIEI